MTTSFGRYELMRPLDRGGMGEVFLARARAPERVHKLVVLKRIRAERLSDERARTRFADEARIAMSLVHPHIVPVFEFGEIDGEYFLAMEWLRGGSLSRIAGAGCAPLEWQAVALVGSQLCDALAYVHSRTNARGALVHGDVTPRNVLLSSEGHALLSDFGLASFAARGRAGTLRYRAPEQARGEAFDGRADLYALALALSEAATGKLAHDDDAERAEKQTRVGVMPELSSCDQGLAAVLRHALSALPEGRYADAAAMRAAFDALLDREPGARARGRSALLARISTAVRESPEAAQSRSGTASATATHAPWAERRRGVVVAVLLASAVAATMTLAAWRHHARVQSAQKTSPSEQTAQRAAPVANEPSASSDKAPPIAPATKMPASESATNEKPKDETTPSEKTSDKAPAATETAPAKHAGVTPKPTREHKHVAEAALDLNAKPWAHVRIDGEPHGETPLLGVALPAGAHHIELTNEPLGIRRELDLTLRPGEHVQRVEDLLHP